MSNQEFNPQNLSNTNKEFINLTDEEASLYKDLRYLPREGMSLEDFKKVIYLDAKQRSNFSHEKATEYAELMSRSHQNQEEMSTDEVDRLNELGREAREANGDRLYFDRIQDLMDKYDPLNFKLNDLDEETDEISGLKSYDDEIDEIIKNYPDK